MVKATELWSASYRTPENLCGTCGHARDSHLGDHRCTVHGLPQYRDHAGPRLLEAHERIAALAGEARREAMTRASRSYWAPKMCVEHDGCTRDGDEIVWPDGERWPTRAEGT
jgi:hypothetical protein